MENNNLALPHRWDLWQDLTKTSLYRQTRAASYKIALPHPQLSDYSVALTEQGAALSISMVRKEKIHGNEVTIFSYYL
jgi:hypothetical protein